MAASVLFVCVLLPAAATAEIAAGCSEMLPKVCFRTPGYAFPAAPTALACCASCGADARCAAWTFIQGDCHLKNVTDNRSTCGDGTSGVVAGRGPSPPPPAPAGALNVLMIVVDDLRFAGRRCSTCSRSLSAPSAADYSLRIPAAVDPSLAVLMDSSTQCTRRSSTLFPSLL